MQKIYKNRSNHNGKKIPFRYFPIKSKLIFDIQQNLIGAIFNYKCLSFETANKNQIKSRGSVR